MLIGCGSQELRHVTVRMTFLHLQCLEHQLRLKYLGAERAETGDLFLRWSLHSYIWLLDRDGWLA